MSIWRTESWKFNGPKGAGLLLAVWLGLSAAQGIQSLPSGSLQNLRHKPVREVPAPAADPVESEPPAKKGSPPRGLASGDEVLVAIIDTGVDVQHPALAPFIWKNQGEVGLDSQGRDKSNNGVDDDGNGFIDDVHGFDFNTKRGAVKDLNGHGTHIAGIIAARLKTAGIENVKFMVLNYYRDGIDGPTALHNSIECVRYAIQMNAKIINYSGGGLYPNPRERQIFMEAERRGILVVAAAGNEASNSESSPFFPANYGFSNILSVTAVDGASLRILPSSNYGKRSVHVAASGKDIRSTLPGGLYGTMTGTSQATAVVTGHAIRAYLQGDRPSPEMVMEMVLASSSPQRGLAGKTQAGTLLADRDLDWIEAKAGGHSRGKNVSSALGEALLKVLTDGEERGLVVKSSQRPAL